MSKRFKRTKEQYENFKRQVVEELELIGEGKAVAQKLGCNVSDVSWVITTLNLHHLISKCRSIEPVEEIPELELAYLLGLIATDGCLASDKTQRVQIGLVEEDRDTVYWVASKLSTNKLPSYRPLPPTDTFGVQGSYTFGAKCPRFYQQCKDFGLTPKKTHTLDVNLEGKSDEFLWYFLRGVIDGDGCVYTPTREKERRSNACVQIASASKVFLKKIQLYFGGTISLTTKESENKSNLWGLYFKGNLAKTLIKHLPQEDYMMSRKTNKMNILTDIPISHITSRSTLKGIIWDNLEKYPQPKNWKMRYREIENPVVSFNQVKHRIFDYGWSEDDALFTPTGTIANRQKFPNKKSKEPGRGLSHKQIQELSESPLEDGVG
jgi:hypothetical protein